MPEDHFRARRLLQQAEGGDGSSRENDCPPKPQQPAPISRQLRDEPDHSQKQCAPHHPSGADRVIDRPRHASSEVGQRDKNQIRRIVNRLCVEHHPPSQNRDRHACEYQDSRRLPLVGGVTGRGPFLSSWEQPCNHPKNQRDPQQPINPNDTLGGRPAVVPWSENQSSQKDPACGCAERFLIDPRRKNSFDPPLLIQNSAVKQSRTGQGAARVERHPSPLFKFPFSLLRTSTFPFYFQPLHLPLLNSIVCTVFSTIIASNVSE